MQQYNEEMRLFARHRSAESPLETTARMTQCSTGSDTPPSPADSAGADADGTALPPTAGGKKRNGRIDRPQQLTAVLYCTTPSTFEK
jgi:hypothetical protein